MYSIHRNDILLLVKWCLRKLRKRYLFGCNFDHQGCSCRSNQVDKFGCQDGRWAPTLGYAWLVEPRFEAVNSMSKFLRMLLCLPLNWNVTYYCMYNDWLFINMWCIYRYRYVGVMFDIYIWLWINKYIHIYIYIYVHTCPICWFILHCGCIYLWWIG